MCDTGEIEVLAVLNGLLVKLVPFVVCVCGGDKCVGPVPWSEVVGIKVPVGLGVDAEKVCCCVGVMTR